MELHSCAEKCSLLAYDAACNDTYVYIRHWYTVTKPQCFSTPEDWNVHVNVTKLTSVIGPTMNGHTGCPTRYRTRHFFNNFTTNKDIATTS
jgi:hypothetical protein